MRFLPPCSILKGISVELAVEKGNGTEEVAWSWSAVAVAVGPQIKSRQSQPCLSSSFRTPERGELGKSKIRTKKIKPSLPRVRGLSGVYLCLSYTLCLPPKKMIEGASRLGCVLLRQKTSAFLGPQGAQTELDSSVLLHRLCA